jgi:ParB-like chromosome segregation protein Spo0J
MALDKIVEIKLTDIHADYDWNCRTGNPAEAGDSGGEAEENEFKGLIESIRARGQDQAVTVKPRGKGFFLVVGFRRYSAMQVIAEGNKNATIKCIVKTLSDIEAKSLNIRENTARKQVSPPDLMKGLADLRDLHRKSGGAPTIDALAAEVGMGRGYASRLFKIKDNVLPKILEAWHKAPASIGVNKMEEIAKFDKPRQEEAFEAMLPKAGRGSRSDKKAWLESAHNEAIRVGTFLGKLEHLKLINTDGLDFSKHLEHCVKVKDGDAAPTKNQREALVKEITDAWQAALTPPPPEEKKEKEPKVDKAKDGKAAKGATAN